MRPADLTPWPAGRECRPPADVASPVSCRRRSPLLSLWAGTYGSPEPVKKCAQAEFERLVAGHVGCVLEELPDVGVAAGADEPREVGPHGVLPLLGGHAGSVLGGGVGELCFDAAADVGLDQAGGPRLAADGQVGCVEAGQCCLELR